VSLCATFWTSGAAVNRPANPAVGAALVALETAFKRFFQAALLVGAEAVKMGLISGSEK
jgi:hypothetical protein